jgi:hypothetical protein
LTRRVSAMTGKELYWSEDALRELRRWKRYVKELRRAFPRANF